MATQDDRDGSESSDARSKTTIDGQEERYYVMPKNEKNPMPKREKNPMPKREKKREKREEREEHAPVNMREMYWKVVHEAQTQIRKANPGMAAKEVLKLARAECFGGIKCKCEIISTYHPIVYFFESCNPLSTNIL